MVAAASLSSEFRPHAIAAVLGIVAAVLLLSIAGPVLARIRAAQAARADSRAARASARIEAETELEVRSR